MESISIRECSFLKRRFLHKTQWYNMHSPGVLVLKICKRLGEIGKEEFIFFAQKVRDSFGIATLNTDCHVALFRHSNFAPSRVSIERTESTTSDELSPDMIDGMDKTVKMLIAPENYEGECCAIVSWYPTTRNEISVYVNVQRGSAVLFEVFCHHLFTQSDMPPNLQYTVKLGS